MAKGTKLVIQIFTGQNKREKGRNLSTTGERAASHRHAKQGQRPTPHQQQALESLNSLKHKA